MSTGPQPYQYEPLPAHLDGHSKHIRILILEPSSPSSESLRAVLRQYPLDEIDGKYEALSYTWGEPQFPGIMNIEGKQIKITENLHDCLRRLSGKALRYLWIDAICINQWNPSERSAQVAIMDQIYSRASRTLIWLGKVTPSQDCDPQALFELLVEKGRRHSDTEKHRNKPVKSFDRTALEFLSQPYWNRRWIIQEIALARKALLIWGAYELSWVDLMLVATYVWPLDHMEHMLYQLAESMPWSGSPSDRSILDIMYGYRHTECADPIDRVAALLALSARYGRGLDYAGDYTKSVSANYRHFAGAIARTLDCGQLLIHAVLFEHDMSTLPSWAPDWRHKLRLGQKPPSSRVEMYHQATLASEDILKLRGWIIQNVQDCVLLRQWINRKFEFPDKHWIQEVLQNNEKVFTFTLGRSHKVYFLIQETARNSKLYRLNAFFEATVVGDEEVYESDESSAPDGSVEILLV